MLRKQRNIKEKDLGFSLIEISVVMVIIAVAAIGVSLAMGGSLSHRHAHDDANQLIDLMRFAQNRALMTHSNYGLITYQDGYAFLKQNSKQRWKIVQAPDVLKRVYLSNDVAFKLDRQQIQKRTKRPLQPEIYIDSDGLSNQFEIIFFSRAGKKLATVVNSADETMSLVS